MSLQKLRLAERYVRLLLARLFVRARPAAAEPRRILVLGYAGIGDVLFLLPFLRAVREGRPKAHIVFVSDPSVCSAEVLPPLGLFDEHWTYGYAALKEQETRDELTRRVREGGFDVAVVCPATPLLAFAVGLLSIPVRVGHCRPLALPRGDLSWLAHVLQVVRRGVIAGEFEKRLVLNRKVWVDADGEHAVTRGLRLAQALGLKTPALEASRPTLPDDARAEERAAALLPDAPGRVTVGLHIGSPFSQYNKIWPAAQWGRACRLLTERYPSLRFALLGGPDERPLAAEFASTFEKGFLDLTGQESLLVTFALARRCALMLVNDTGIAKAAMASGVPTATVWGPSAPSDCGSPWDREKHLDIRIELPCSPCARLGMPQVGGGVLNYSNCGHHDCLRLMEPGVVAASIASRYDALLSGR